MTEPDFMPTGGARRALAWTRLKSVTEVGDTKPAIDWPPRWAWSLEEQTLKVAASEKQNSPASGDGWPLPSVFSFGGLQRLRAEAERILQAHCFPIADPFPVWRWLEGRGLCWTPRPEESGRIEGEPSELAYIDDASIEAWSRPDAFAQWPTGSAFAWARNIVAEARYLDIAHDRLADLGASSRLVELVYAHGFRVGQMTALGAVPTYPVPLEVVLQREAVALEQSKAARDTNALRARFRRQVKEHAVAFAAVAFTKAPAKKWTLSNLSDHTLKHMGEPPPPSDCRPSNPDRVAQWERYVEVLSSKFITELLREAARENPELSYSVLLSPRR